MNKTENQLNAEHLRNQPDLERKIRKLIGNRKPYTAEEMRATNPCPGSYSSNTRLKAMAEMKK